MTVEWWSKTENSVEYGRSSTTPIGGFKLTPVSRVRQPLMAKEPLCGIQSTNLSLVIAVFCFPSCFTILLFFLNLTKEVDIDNGKRFFF
jgi:hypothetical protein